MVTANKALIAEHGAELAALAEANGAPLLFEAAVMGGTPAVKMLREAMVGDEVEAVAGILNGTCNYILTEMEATGPRLRRGAGRGPARSATPRPIRPWTSAASTPATRSPSSPPWPSAARRPSPPPRSRASTAIELLDIRLAKDLGYRIKLVASAVRSAAGVSVRVHPALAPLDHPLAQAGRRAERPLHRGHADRPHLHPGARRRGGPTAAAVAADIADVMAGASRPVFQTPAGDADAVRAGRRQPHASGRAYLRLMVRDEPGVIAAISETLAEAGVSIDSFLQKPVEGAGGVPIVLTTHAAPEAAYSRGGRAHGRLAGDDRAAAPDSHRAHLRIRRRWSRRQTRQETLDEFDRCSTAAW